MVIEATEILAHFIAVMTSFRDHVSGVAVAGPAVMHVLVIVSCTCLR